MSQTISVHVKDVDRHCEQAKARGARILQPPADHPYGERQYTVEDLAGHRWTFSQSIADIAPEEWGATSVFPIFLREADSVAAFVDAVEAPVNILALPQAPPVPELAELGVARVSYGSLLHRGAMEGLTALIADLQRQQAN